MPGDHVMDFEMMLSGVDVSERAVKSDIEETPIASNALMTLDEFLGCDYEGDNWPKNNFSSTSQSSNVSDSWYVTSVTRDCSTESYDSDGKTSKQITIRLPLKSRRIHTTESMTSYDDTTLHHPACVTPDSSEINNEPKFPIKVVKTEISEKEILKRPCSSNILEISAKRAKANIDENKVAEELIVKSEVKNVKPPRKTRKPRTYKYDPKPLKRKDGKKNIPDVLKDEEYWENRKRNNEAAKKSRVNRRTKELELISRMGLLEDENNVLKKSVKKLLEMNSKLEAELAMVK